MKGFTTNKKNDDDENNNNKLNLIFGQTFVGVTKYKNNT